MRPEFLFALLILFFLSPLRVSAMASFRDEEKKDAARGANEEQRVPIQRHQERGTTASSTVEEEKREETKSTLDESAAADQEEAKEEIKTALSLEDFREALERHPNAGRLIVVRESNGALSIQPREASPNRFGPSRAENQMTIDTLRSLIPSEVSADPNLANLLAYRERSTVMAMHIDPLTPERLRGILQRFEEVVSIGARPTLEDFRKATTNPAHAKVDRLILDPKTRAIRPWSQGDSKVKGKDKNIIESLKAALQADFPRISIEQIIQEELPSKGIWILPTFQKQPFLSITILQRILEKADKEMLGFYSSLISEVRHQVRQASIKKNAALDRWDTASAKLQEKIVRLLENTQGAEYYYRKAANAEIDGSKEATDAYRRIADAYHRAAQARIKQAAALDRGDTAAAELQYDIAVALGDRSKGFLGFFPEEGAGYLYIKAAEEEAKKNREAADACRRAAQARNEQAAALVRGDKAAAKLQGNIAAALGMENNILMGWGAGYLYIKAAEEEAKKNQEAANAYHKSAQALKKRATALALLYEKAAELQLHIAWLFWREGVIYSIAAEEHIKDNKEAVNAYRKCARVCREQAATLVAHETAPIYFNAKASYWPMLEKCGILFSIADFYVKAKEEDTKGNRKAATAYKKAARSYEQMLVVSDEGNIEAAKTHLKEAETFKKEAEALALQIETLEQQGRNSTNSSNATKAKAVGAEKAEAKSDRVPPPSQENKPSAPAPNPRRPDKDNPDPAPPKKENCTIS